MVKKRQEPEEYLRSGRRTKGRTAFIVSSNVSDTEEELEHTTDYQPANIVHPVDGFQRLKFK